MKLHVEPEKNSGLNGIQNHGLRDTGSSLNFFSGLIIISQLLLKGVCKTAMINHVFISSFFAVQVYDLSYIQ